MSLGTRVKALCWLAAAGLALAACSTATQVVIPPAATTDPGVAASATAAEAASQAAEDQARVATGIAATLTAAPTATATNTPVPTATHTPTNTPTTVPTSTPKPTDTAVPATLAPTRPAATQPPVSTHPPAATAAPTRPPAPASVYSSGGGPQGYFTDIQCNRNGADCTPVMPPGDINFDLFLGSADDAPVGLFLPYGLAVARDGVNIADMFMFVDAGWLAPGSIVGFGASRNFSVPGRYVIRSSGCYTDGSVVCGWTNFAGTVVTFVIE
jgi:hypothetical protein